MEDQPDKTSPPTNDAQENDAPTLGAERNGKQLLRTETVPDIKRDTSGVTTQYIAAGIVNLGAFAAGVCMSWSSSVLPLLVSPHNATASGHHEETTYVVNGTYHHHPLAITEYEGSWAASFLCMGAMWGAVPAGLVSEYFGRKKTLLYLALPLLVSWILVASSPNVYGVYVGRFVSGVALGALSVAVPPYVADVAEPQLLPSLANFYHVQLAAGLLFGYIVGMLRSTAWISVFGASIPIVFFVGFLFMPESPAYLMSQGKLSESKTALRYFRGIDNDIDQELRTLRENIRSYAKNKATFKELFSVKSTFKAMIVCLGLMIFQQMTGIYPVLFYAEKILTTFSISMYPPSAAIIIGFFLVSSTYFSTILLRTVRRRVLLMFSFTVMSLCAGSLAIYYNIKASVLMAGKGQTWAPLFVLCVFVSVYAAGVGPIPWLMLREIFPSNVTRRVTAIMAGFHWLFAFGVTKLYQNLEEKLKLGWVLWNFAVLAILGTVFVYFLVPETKGRTLQDIQNEFSGIHKKRKHRHVIEVESASES